MQGAAAGARMVPSAARGAVVSAVEGRRPATATELMAAAATSVAAVMGANVARPAVLTNAATPVVRAASSFREALLVPAMIIAASAPPRRTQQQQGHTLR